MYGTLYRLDCIAVSYDEGSYSTSCVDIHCILTKLVVKHIRLSFRLVLTVCIYPVNDE